MHRDVFQAIADPVRREMIHMMSAGPMRVSDVAERFTVSRPAISKHMKVLQQCGLVSISKQGRERYCRAELQSLQLVADWAEQYRTHWTATLKALDRYVTQSQNKDVTYE